MGKAKFQYLPKIRTPASEEKRKSSLGMRAAVTGWQAGKVRNQRWHQTPSLADGTMALARFSQNQRDLFLACLEKILFTVFCAVNKPSAGRQELFQQPASTKAFSLW